MNPSSGHPSPSSSFSRSLGLAADLASETPVAGGFPLVEGNQGAPILLDEAEHAGVKRAAADLQADIERVTKVQPRISTSQADAGKAVIIVGTLGQSALVDALAASGKIKAAGISGQWESFLIATVADPLPGVDQALVIAGSDKRGTIYGLYEISEQIGVSPWYWWADVPATHREALYIKPGAYEQGPPAVKYRGIFLNDEAPALTGWAKEKFGGLNRQLYVQVFELLLRLRGNYLWPAMWRDAFNEDDTENPRLADEYGIVMGTSHHEPMLRSQQEWKRHGSGPWNYATNEATLKAFWEEGVQRNRDFESIVTIGMRGDGDRPMVEGNDMDANVKLLEKIVADQRELLAKSINPEPAQVPQIWAIYKEVQDYYDHGMRVPDDVTLLWCDDNWGNIRRLPTPEERRRSGGAGMYYHFDYYGGPRSYRWLNTTPLPKIWEQMNLAYRYGADRIWIVNVGDLKPLEAPTEFFLRMAWDPSAMTKENVAEFEKRWAEREFGPEQAEAIAEILAKYAKYNGWRKPELLEPGTFSLTNYREAERVSAAWSELVAKAEKLNAALPPEKQDAFFQLILYPTKASATVCELYIAAARNQLHAKQGRASANAEAARVRELFQQDQALSDYYNLSLSGGKWNHMMDQVRIGYTIWKEPDQNIPPTTTELTFPDTADFGVAIEGSPEAWPGASTKAVLPPFDSLNRQRSYIDLFARGSRPFAFQATVDQAWISLQEDKAPGAGDDRRLWVEIDWEKAPKGLSCGLITISGEGGSSEVKVSASKASKQQTEEAKGCFGGLVGPITLLAQDAPKKVEAGGARWEKIPDCGRGVSSMSIFPVTAASILPPSPAPYLEFPIYIARGGKYAIDAIIGSTLNFVPGRGLRLAVSVGNEPPQVVDAFPGRESQEKWDTAVKDNVRVLSFEQEIPAPGRHILRVTMVDPGVVLERLVIHDTEVPASYFGPPENTLNGAALPIHGV